MTDNIFAIGRVVTGESFIGRKSYIEEFKREFDYNQKFAVSLVGLTRFGKSSLIANAFNKQNCLEHGTLYCSIGSLGQYSYNELWQQIISEIADQVNKIGKMDDELKDEINKLEDENIPWIKFINTVKNIFEILKEKGLGTLLILDEFDRARDVFGEETRHWEFCRTLFSSDNYLISVITISRRQHHTIEGKTYQSSTFHGIFNHIYLKGFDKSDMDEYFNIFPSKYGIELDDSQKTKIIYYAGNAPFLLSIIGHYIVDTASIGESIDIDRIFLNKCKAINDYYNDCIKYLEYDNALEKIIPFVIGPKIGVRKKDEDELKNLGYLDVQNGNYIAISQYFSEYFLFSEVADLDIYKELLSAEKNLRQLLQGCRSKLIKFYKATGNDILSIEKNILINAGLQNNINRYEVYIDKNHKIFNKNSTYFDVMSLGDMVKIISDRWSFFRQYFEDKNFAEWQYKFTLCAKARNPLMHAHEEFLTDKEEDLVKLYSQDIFKVSKTSLESMDNVPESDCINLAKEYQTCDVCEKEGFLYKFINSKNCGFICEIDDLEVAKSDPYHKGIYFYCDDIQEFHVKWKDKINTFKYYFKVKYECEESNNGKIAKNIQILECYDINTQEIISDMEK